MVTKFLCLNFNSPHAITVITYPGFEPTTFGSKVEVPLTRLTRLTKYEGTNESNALACRVCCSGIYAMHIMTGGGPKLKAADVELLDIVR